ncbi:hypothetical protein EV359DRAFT_87889 [Lentinula novae-zelandiae]|nr:hypothetical protein EV359DRAFT_87889 [Lentinula novae-zelandiae]
MSGNESDSISESNNTPEFSFASDAKEPRAIDDWMCLALTFVLNHDAPYPFDFMLWGAQGSYRFHVRNLDDGNYGITDENAPYNELTLPAQLLNDTTFKPGACTDLGDVYMQGMKFVLTCGIPAYPKSAFTALYDPFEQFVTYKTSGDDEDEYYFEDQENHLFSKHLPISVLCNTKFNLVGWWCKQLTRSLHDIEVRLEQKRIATHRKAFRKAKRSTWTCQKQDEIIAYAVAECLELNQPFPGDPELLERFYCHFDTWMTSDNLTICILDLLRNIRCDVSMEKAIQPDFKPGELWNEVCAHILNVPEFTDMDYSRIGHLLETTARNKLVRHIPFIPAIEAPGYSSRDNYSVYIDPKDSSQFIIADEGRDFETRISVNLLIQPQFNLPAWYRKHLENAENELLLHLRGPIELRALIDSGSLGDFMSTQLSDQLKVTKQFHKTPIPLHLAIQGSRSKIHCGTTVNLRYQSIHADHYFDIANISNYDLILGTPWLFQYQVRIGLNPTTIEVGSDVPTAIQGDNVAEVRAQSMSIDGDDLEGA